MADTPIYLLSLCSGTAMLDEGVCLALSGSRVVAYVEREAYAAALLLARMADSALAPAPIWCGNLETFDAGQWHEIVDGITAGFPCQPWSAAGKREGTADVRWIWPSIAEIIRTAQPDFVFLENVPGLAVGLGLNSVLGEIAEMGFDAEWCHIAASDVGAAHQRERIFILAIRTGGRFGELWQSSEWCQRFFDRSDARVADANNVTRGTEQKQQSDEWTNESGRCGTGILADAERDRGWEQEPQRGSERRTATDGTSGTMADAVRTVCGEQRPRRQRILNASQELADTNRGQRKQQWWIDQEQRKRLSGSYGGSEPMDHAEGIGDRSRGLSSGEIAQDTIADLSDRELADGESAGRQGIARQPTESRWEIEAGSVGCHGGKRIFAPPPASSDWRSVIAEQPWLAPAIESSVCGVVDGNAVVVDESRADQLRAIGNGVVALQAAAAFVILARRLTSAK